MEASLRVISNRKVLQITLESRNQCTAEVLTRDTISGLGGFCFQMFGEIFEYEFETVDMVVILLTDSKCPQQHPIAVI